MHGRAAITVRCPSDEAYRTWHDFENLPRFMTHLESLQTTGDRRSHWVARGPIGRKFEWDAEITQDVPNKVISWRSLNATTDLPNSGSIRFEPAPGDRGTEVFLELDFEPPGGPIGEAIAQLFGEEPVDELEDDLRRFKQVLETGEVVRSEASPDGARPHLDQRPAQPLP